MPLQYTDVSGSLMRGLFRSKKLMRRGLGVVAGCLLLILSSLPVEARNHYIVAFDLSVPRYSNSYRSARLLRELDEYMSICGFDRENDYLSIVGYTLEADHPDMDRFVRPYTSANGDEMLWRKVDGARLTELFPNWPQGEPIVSSSTPMSMQSLAKQYVVMSTGVEPDTAKLADRTVMVIVSDEEVNGLVKDFKDEWKNAKSSGGANTAMFNALQDSVFDRMSGFNNQFRFESANRSANLREHVIDYEYKMIPYVVVPTEKPSIHAVTDLPSPLPLKRVKGGFKLDAKTQTINPKYRLRDVSLFTAGGKLLGQASDGTLDVFIPSSRVKAGDSISVAMDLAIVDGYYNGALMSASNPRYRDGMNIRQAVTIRDEAKVLGIWPLADSFWWFFPNDVFTMVMIWDLVILLCIIILICIIAYRIFLNIITYRPSDEVLKITKL